MKVSIIAVGKIREKWIQEGIAEYSKRLKRFHRINLMEVADEKAPDTYSAKEIIKAVDKEGSKILARWPSDAWSIALSPKGDQLGSEGLADLISRQAVAGRSHFLFIIGGSNGLSQEVLGKCNRKLSFGSHTFPHQLFRVMLLEQIYRAEKIRAGETYHK